MGRPPKCNCRCSSSSSSRSDSSSPSSSSSSSSSSGLPCLTECAEEIGGCVQVTSPGVFCGNVVIPAGTYTLTLSNNTGNENHACAWVYDDGDLKLIHYYQGPAAGRILASRAGGSEATWCQQGASVCLTGAGSNYRWCVNPNACNLLVEICGSEQAAFAAMRQTPDPVYRDPADDVFIPKAVTKECGKCKKRKAALNAIVPGAGDLVEKFTTATGIKRVWNSRYGDEPVTPDPRPTEAPLTASDDPGDALSESNTQGLEGHSTASKRRVYQDGEIRPRKPKGEGI